MPPGRRGTSRSLVTEPAPTRHFEVGESPVAALFYEGRYHDVLTRTIDSPQGTAPYDVAFALGALAFVGRVVEAEALFAGGRRGAAPARSLAAGAFFLAVAECRSGRFDDARRVLRTALADTSRRRDEWSRALLLQGAACVRYFTGRFDRAAVVAKVALGCALRAGFAYAQVLANDLRGHALAQRGHVTEGLAVLEHARTQAARLGYAVNAHAIEVSVALHRARVASPARAEAILREIAAREATQDSYSRRAIKLELAPLLAWMGRCSEAEALLAEAFPLCAGERRQMCWLATARAHVARIRGGWQAARPHIEAAERDLQGEHDPVRRVEVVGLRLALARASGDGRARVEAETELLRIAERGGPARARAWLAVHAEGEVKGRGEDDTMTAPLAAVSRGSVAAALREGLYGLVPEAVGLAPGRRVHLFEDLTLVENHGDIASVQALSERSRAVLVALAGGACTRASLLAEAWRIRGYAPDRHDTVLKTAVSRLRASLGAAGEWVVARAGGYELAEGVEVVQHEVGGDARVASRGLVVPPRVDERVGRNDRQRRILAALERTPSATVSEVAASLKEPVRTVSRELAAMCEDRLVARVGAGRATSYRVRARDVERG